MPPTSRNYCFTLQVPDGTPDPAVFAEGFVRTLGTADAIRYAIWQLERAPTSGQLHLQGYLELSAPMRMPGVAKLFGEQLWPHLEPRRGLREQARDYCSKQDTRVAGPWECGVWQHGGQGRRVDLAALKQSIDEGNDDLALWEEHFSAMCRYHQSVNVYRNARATHQSGSRTVTTHVYWGPPGTGKSFRALAEASAPSDPATATPGDIESGDGVGERVGAVPRFDLETPFYVPHSSHGAVWFDGYDPAVHKSIIIDDFYGWLPWHFLLRLLDHYPLLLPVKGGHVPAAFTRVFITSNVRPSQWYTLEKLPGQSCDPLLRRINTCTHLNTPFMGVVDHRARLGI